MGGLRATSSRQPRGGSLMYPAKDCTTMVVAAHSGLCAANLTHLAREEEDEEEEDEDEEEEEDEDEEEVDELQKMHPSRGGSLTEHTTPVKTRARIKQATPTIYNTGSCAVSTIDPACKEGPCGRHSGFAAVCKSNRFQQFAKTTIPRLRILHNSSNKIVMSIIILQKTHPSEEEEEEEEEEERGCASSMSYHITAYILSQFGMQCLKSTVKTFREKEKRADIFIEYKLQKEARKSNHIQPFD